MSHIACDTSVLINFVKIDQCHLFQKHSHSFWVTDHVQDEIKSSYPKQQLRFEKALNQGIFRKTTIQDPEEFNLFSKLRQSGQLGSGECAVIALATHRKYKLAIDDNQAIKKAETLLPPASILRTQDLIVSMIQENIIDLAAADKLIYLWSTEHRFKLKIQSFKELMEPTLVR